MGTNYFLQVFTPEEIQEIKDLINQGSFLGANRILNDEESIIHIGKCSAGWAFNWNHNDFKYFTNRKEMEDWLHSGIIVTENGTVVSNQDFWKMVNDFSTLKETEIHPDFGVSFSTHTWFR